MKFLCGLGWHRWRYQTGWDLDLYAQRINPVLRRRCRRCGMERIEP